MGRYQNGNSTTFLYEFIWAQPYEVFELTKEQEKTANAAKLVAAGVIVELLEPTTIEGTTIIETTTTEIKNNRGTPAMTTSPTGTSITPPLEVPVNTEEADFIEKQANANADAEKRISTPVVYSEGGAEKAKTSDQHFAEEAAQRKANPEPSNVHVFHPSDVAGRKVPLVPEDGEPAIGIIPEPTAPSGQNSEDTFSANVPENIAQKDGDTLLNKPSVKKTTKAK